MSQYTQGFTLIEEIHRFGSKPASVTSFNVISPMARALPDYLSAPQTIKVAAVSTTDTASGTGARNVEIKGVGSGWIAQTETVWLNGNTPVDTALEWLRVDRAKVLYAGSNGVNAGSIFIGYGTVTNALPASLLGQIDAGDGRTEQMTITIPMSREAHVHHFDFATGKAGGGSDVISTVRVRVRERMRGDESWQVRWLSETISMVEFNSGDTNAFIIQGPADVVMEASASGAARWAADLIYELHKDLQ